MFFFFKPEGKIHPTTAIQTAWDQKVSDFGDSRPNYVLSAGSYIYKDWIPG